MFKLTYVEALAQSRAPISLFGRFFPSRAHETMARKSAVKPSQRYRLNRLAEKLVTPERFDIFSPEWMARCSPDPRTLIIFDEMDSVSPSLDGKRLYDLLSEAICPYGNPDCHLPDAPMGYGLHRPCYERQYRRYTVDGHLTDGEAALIWSSNA
jgi:hypothetical protein